MLSSYKNGNGRTQIAIKCGNVIKTNSGNERRAVQQ